MGKKDLTEKEYFREPKRFADLGNAILYGGKQVIMPEDLSEAETEYFYFDESDTKSCTVDVAKKWVVKNVIVSLIILEGQSDTDYKMVFRSLITDALAYNEQLKARIKKHKEDKDLSTGAEYISGISKNDKFYPVVNIVVYFGAEKWDGARCLHEMLEINDDLKPFVNNHRINLFDYHDYDNFDMFKTQVRLVFKALSCSNDKVKFRENFITDKEVVDGETLRLVGTLLNVKNIEKYIEKDEETGEERGYMCKALEELLEDERIEGREEGREEGTALNEIGLVIKKVAREKNINQIIDELESTEEKILPIYDLVILYPEKNAEEIYELLHPEE